MVANWQKLKVFNFKVYYVELLLIRNISVFILLYTKYQNVVGTVNVFLPINFKRLLLWLRVSPIYWRGSNTPLLHRLVPDLGSRRTPSNEKNRGSELNFLFRLRLVYPFVSLTKTILSVRGGGSTRKRSRSLSLLWFFLNLFEMLVSNGWEYKL